MADSTAPFRFTLPTVSDNPNGWGPVKESEELSKIPYAPYSKSDRLGKIADWTAPAEGQYGYDRRDDRQGGRRYGRTQEVFGSGTASAFAYTHTAEDEQSFSVVDRGSTAQKKPGFKPARGGRAGAVRTGGAGGAGGGTWQAAGRGAAAGRGGRDDRRGQQGQRRRYGYNDKQTRTRDSSIVIGSEWKVVEELDFPRLNKLNYNVEEPEDLSIYGSTGYYDKAYDRVSTKQEKTLQNTNADYPNVTTSDDPVIQDLSKDGEDFNVYATDTILAALMCASRSVYSWDIVVTKAGDKLYLDKRDGSNLDLVNVNENAADPPMESTEKDAINTPIQLAIEASNIQRNLAQQVVRDNEKIVYSDESPLSDFSPEPCAPAIYRYRQWSLGEGTNLIVRTQVDAALHQPTGTIPDPAPEPQSSAHPSEETLLVNVRGLNEFDSRAAGSGGAPDWRQKLDSQRGAVMATEIKNNSNKLARWTVESVLGGVNMMRLAFVSRVGPKNTRAHVVLGTASVKPKEFAAQMNYSLGNGWGIVKTFVELCKGRLGDGKYVLVKDPNKPVLRLYSVPANAFDVVDDLEDEVDAEIDEEEL